jgi:hypothetical protein
MTKGEAYRAYYEKNREKILEQNRLRREAERERKAAENSEAQHEADRQRKRESYFRTKGKTFAKMLEETADKEGNEFWRPFFRRIAVSPAVGDLTLKHMEFLLRLAAGLPGSAGSSETISLV